MPFLDLRFYRFNHFHSITKRNCTWKYCPLLPGDISEAIFCLFTTSKSWEQHAHSLHPLKHLTECSGIDFQVSFKPLRWIHMITGASVSYPNGHWSYIMTLLPQGSFSLFLSFHFSLWLPSQHTVYCIKSQSPSITCILNIFILIKEIIFHTLVQSSALTSRYIYFSFKSM